MVMLSLGLGVEKTSSGVLTSSFHPLDLSPNIYIETGVNSSNIITTDGSAQGGYAITTKAEYTGVTFTNGGKTLTVSGGVGTEFNDVYAFGFNTGGESVYLGAIDSASGTGCNFANEWTLPSITDGILRCVKATTIKELGNRSLDGDWEQSTLNLKPYVATTGLKFHGGQFLEKASNYGTRTFTNTLYAIINFMDDTTGVAIIGSLGDTTTAIGSSASSNILARFDSTSNASSVAISTETLYKLGVISDAGTSEIPIYLNSNSVTGTIEGATLSNWNIGQIGAMNDGTRFGGTINVIIVLGASTSTAENIVKLNNYYANIYS